MKQLKAIFTFVLVVIFSGTFLVACSKKKNEDPKTPYQIAQEKFDIAYAALLNAKNYAQDIERKDIVNGEVKDTKKIKIITNRSGNDTHRYHENGDGTNKQYSLVSLSDSNLTLSLYRIDTKKYSTKTEPIDQIIMNEGSGSVSKKIVSFEYLLSTFDFKYNDLFSYFYESYKDSDTTTTINYYSMAEQGFTFSTCEIKTSNEKLTYTVSINSENKVSSVKMIREDAGLEGYMQVISTFRYTGDDLSISVNTDGFTYEDEGIFD